MPSSAGPQTSGEENLIFIYDVGDTSNCYLGEPTTNIAASGGLVGMSGITLTDLGIEDGWRKYSMSGTFTGGGYPYIMHISAYGFTGGVVYSSACTVKTNVGYKFNYFGAEGLSYVNQPLSIGGTLTSTLNPDGSRTVARYGFAYTNTTSQPGYLYTNPVNNTTFDPNTDFVWIKDLQVEQKPYNTQFTPGFRSVTGSLFNLEDKPNSSVDIGSVSYTTTQFNPQIYFDGTDDVITTTSGFPSSLSAYTIEYVARLDAAARMPIAYYPNTSFYKYGDFSWYYTHGGVSDEFYYPGGSITGWGYWAITYDGANVKVYRNGVYLGAKASSGTANFSGGWRIGYWSAMGNYAWQGLIPVVKIYSRALTENETINNYQNYKTRFNLP